MGALVALAAVAISAVGRCVAGRRCAAIALGVGVLLALPLRGLGPLIVLRLPGAVVVASIVPLARMAIIVPAAFATVIATLAAPLIPAVIIPIVPAGVAAPVALVVSPRWVVALWVVARALVVPPLLLKAALVSRAGSVVGALGLVKLVLRTPQAVLGRSGLAAEAIQRPSERAGLLLQPAQVSDEVGAGEAVDLALQTRELFLRAAERVGSERLLALEVLQISDGAAVREISRQFALDFGPKLLVRPLRPGQSAFGVAHRRIAVHRLVLHDPHAILCVGKLASQPLDLIVRGAAAEGLIQPAQNVIAPVLRPPPLVAGTKPLQRVLRDVLEFVLRPLDALLRIEHNVAALGLAEVLGFGMIGSAAGPGSEVREARDFRLNFRRLAADCLKLLAQAVKRVLVDRPALGNPLLDRAQLAQQCAPARNKLIEGAAGLLVGALRQVQPVLGSLQLAQGCRRAAAREANLYAQAFEAAGDALGLRGASAVERAKDRRTDRQRPFHREPPSKQDCQRYLRHRPQPQV